MEGRTTGVDSLIFKIKNNPVASVLVFLTTLIVALSTFTNAVKNLSGLVGGKEKRFKINGTWKAKVIYDWQNAMYTETFVFKGEGNEVWGTASRFEINRGIDEGKIEKDKITFIIKTRERMGDGDPIRDVVHKYRGKVVNDEIRFVMETQGGYSGHVPIEFTAKKVSDN